MGSVVGPVVRSVNSMGPMVIAVGSLIGAIVRAVDSGGFCSPHHEALLTGT